MEKYSIENLDTLYSAKEIAELRLSDLKTDYKAAKNRLELQMIEKSNEIQKDISDLNELIEMVIGGEEKVTTFSGTYTRHEVDPTKPRSYEVKINPTNELIEYFEKNEDLSVAIQEETKVTKRLLKTPIQEMLANGSLTVTPDGHLVDSNGEVLEIEARLKPVAIKFKPNKKQPTVKGGSSND